MLVATSVIDEMPWALKGEPTPCTISCLAYLPEISSGTYDRLGET